MKKLIILLIVLSVCLSSCGVIGGTDSSSDGILSMDCSHFLTHKRDDKDATCTRKGYTGDVYCSFCGEFLTKGEPTDMLPHDFKGGKCTECGRAEFVFIDPTPPHTHEYTTHTVHPTCTRNGYTTYTCSCGTFYAADKVLPHGHSYDTDVCSVCGALKPEEKTDGCGNHTDDDDNGYCDTCNEYVIVVIDVFAINDMHGKINPSGSQPGIGGLTTYLKESTDENSILLSSGDMWQGTAESNLTYGAFITEWMSELGFVSMTLGNHEFDWTEQYITSNENIASFPFLAINIFKNGTSERVDYATPSVVIERDGVEIGIIGAIGDCYSSISADVRGGYYFKNGYQLTELVKEESERLRAQGVDFIIYSLHGDASSYDYALSDGYVDLVLEGHSHDSYCRLDSEGVYHLQGGGENDGLSFAKLSINSANGNTDVEDASVISSYVYGAYESDPIVGELLEKYDALIGRAGEILGTNISYRDDSEIEQLVAELYYKWGTELWGESVNITLGGGFIRTRSPYNLYAGTVTYADICSLLPFNNQLVLCSISGRDLYNNFIKSKSKDYYIFGDGLSSLEINFSETYYIVTDTYTSSYAPNRLTEIVRYDANLFARDLVAEYIKENWN